MVRKWESEGLNTLGSIIFIVCGSHQSNPMMTSPLLSYFITTLALEEPNPSRKPLREWILVSKEEDPWMCANFKKLL